MLINNLPEILDHVCFHHGRKSLKQLPQLFISSTCSINQTLISDLKRERQYLLFDGHFRFAWIYVTTFIGFVKSCVLGFMYEYQKQNAVIMLLVLLFRYLRLNFRQTIFVMVSEVLCSLTFRL